MFFTYKMGAINLFFLGGPVSQSWLRARCFCKRPCWGRPRPAAWFQEILGCHVYGAARPRWFERQCPRLRPRARDGHSHAHHLVTENLSQPDPGGVRRVNPKISPPWGCRAVLPPLAKVCCWRPKCCSSQHPRIGGMGVPGRTGDLGRAPAASPIISRG